jgi:hypothetical protein
MPIAFASSNPTVYVNNPNYLNYTISSGTVSLTQDLVCGNLTISSGAILETDGYNIYCINNVNLQGTIDTGINNNGGGNGLFIQANNFNCSGGVINSQGQTGEASIAGQGGGGGGSILIAYNGSNYVACSSYNESGGVGGSGQGGGSYANGGGWVGGNTTAAGGLGGTNINSVANPGSAGNTPNAPTLSNSVIDNFLNGGINSFLEGAQGGYGGNVQSGGNGMSYLNSYGGSGGGGGAANPNTGAGANGGNGGAGQLLTYSYSTPIVTINLNLANLFISVTNLEPQITTSYNLNQSGNTNQTVIFSQSMNLTGNLIAYNVVINSGVTLTTNGYSILAYNNFTCSGGVLDTGYPDNGGTGASGSNGGPGGSFPSSYGGSGGAGGSTELGQTGGNGGNTLVNGGDSSHQAGATPTPPNLSDTVINNIYQFGALNQLSGAGGGGGGTVGGSYPALGGSGAYGLLLQANNLNGSGCTINANGQNGAQGEGGTYTSGSSGGGGGGTVILTYGQSYSAPSVDVNGGSNGGGSGSFLTYQYGFAQAIPLSSPPIYYGNKFQIISVGNSGDTLNLSINNDINILTNETPVIFNVSNSTYLNASISAGLNNITVTNTSGDIYAINFQIYPAIPNMTLTTPNNLIYTGNSLSIYANNTLLENGSNPNLMTLNLYLNGINVGTSPENGSLTYSQTGSNLSIGTYTYTFNTTGNQNYTANSITNSFSISKGEIIPYNISSTVLWYPNNMIYNITGIDDANDTLTLNMSLIGYNESEIYSNSSYINDTNVTINLTGLSPGNYTLYMNLTDALGNSILNSTNFRLASYLSYLNLTTPNNLTYNNLNQSVIINTSITQYSAQPNFPNFYVITLNNDQSVNTNNNYTQVITFNGLNNNTLLNGNASNVEFYYLNNNTVIPSWFGGNYSNASQNSSFNTSATLFWFLNVSAEIPAGSSYNIGMGFANMNTDLLNNITIGEAPQLSATYGQYDNGQFIFPNYWNFSGTSLPANFSTYTGQGSVYGTSESSVTVNNGITIASNGNFALLQYDQTLNGALSTELNNVNNINGSYFDFGTFPNNPIKIYDTQIELSNGQDINTSTNFQQKIIFNPSTFSSYVSNNLGNIRFYEGNQELYSWCESGCASNSGNAIFWVKIPSGIPANSNIMINMTFFPTSVNYDGIYAGEYPTATSTYGQYDNGANVFTYYDNFNGTSLSSGWTTYIPSGSSIVVDNGLTMTGANNNDGDSAYIYRNINSNQINNSIVDIYGDLYSGSGSGSWNVNFASLQLYSNNDDITELVSIPSGTGGYSGTPGLTLENVTNGGSGDIQTSVYSVSTSAENVYSFGTNNSTSILYNNYNQEMTYNAPLQMGSGTNLELVSGSITSGTSPDIFAQWIRVRSQPPNMQMPTTIFGNSVVNEVLSVGGYQQSGDVYNTTQNNFTGLDYYNGQFSVVENGSTVFGSINSNNSSNSSNSSIPITILNNQDISTGTNFNQILSINTSQYESKENNNLDNVYFTYPDGQVIPSWLESGQFANGTVFSDYANSSFLSQSVNTTWWLNLSNGINANSGIIIYMNFASSNVLNNSTIGEAPTLSQTYGEYDDGNNVFPLYFNFAGTTLPSSIIAFTGNITVDNGIIANTSSGGTQFYYNGNSYTQNYILNTFGFIPGDGGTGSSGTGAFGYIYAGVNTATYTVFDGWTTDGSYYGLNTGGFGSGFTTTVTTTPISSWQFMSLQMPSTYVAPLDGSIDGTNYTVSNTGSTSSPINIGWIANNNGCSSNCNAIFQWIFAQDAPPNGIMPIVELNSTSGTNALSTSGILSNATYTISFNVLNAQQNFSNLFGGIGSQYNGTIYPTIGIVGNGGNAQNSEVQFNWLATTDAPNGVMPAQSISSLNPSASSVETTFNLYLNTLLVYPNIPLNTQILYIQNDSNLSAGEYTYTLNTSNYSFTNVSITQTFNITQANASFNTNPLLPQNVISFIPVSINNNNSATVINENPLYQNITVDSAEYPSLNSNVSNTQWFWANGTIINALTISGISNTSNSTEWLLDLGNQVNVSSINFYMGIGNQSEIFSNTLSAIANNPNVSEEFGQQYSPTELYVNASQSSTNTWTRVPILINSTNIYNISGLNYEIYSTYPNSSIVAFNSSMTNTSNNFSSAVAGNYEWYMNTTGNANYSGYQTPSIALDINNVTMNLDYNNSNALNQIYPNITLFGVIGNDNANFTNLTLQASLINYTQSDLYLNNNYSNNSVISNITSIGSLGAGTYTIYFNLSDNFGNYITNTTTITISKGNPSMSLSVPSNIIYNNLNQSISAQSNNIFEIGLNSPNNLGFNLTLNGISINNPSANSTFDYTQSGINLSAGTYYYNFSTLGNANYSAEYINDSFTISQATPNTPILLVNGSSTSTTSIANKPVNINSTVSSINNQLIWNIYYDYPNDTLAPVWNSSTGDVNAQFLPSVGGIYSFTINTTGNQNYTALNTGNILLNITSAFNNLLIYNLNGTQVYPNINFFNIYPEYNGNGTLTLNVSINDGDGIIYSSTINNNVNTTINSSNSPLTTGYLGAGTYTISANVSDNYGNYIINSTQFTIDKGTPILSLNIYNESGSSISGSFRNYSNNNYTVNGSGEVYQNATILNTLPFSLTLNNVVVSNPLATNNANWNYTQTGINLSANDYTYNLSTSGNANYTSNYTTAYVNILQITPPNPILTFSNGNTTVTSITNQSEEILANVSSINNQLQWDVNLYYPNGTINSSYFVPTNVNTTYLLSIINTPVGDYNVSISTVGDNNYTTSNNNGNITDNVEIAFNSLGLAQINTPTYPNVPIYNVTTSYNGNTAINLNVSLIKYTDYEIASLSINPKIALQINSSDSNLNIGSLSAGTYTIYFNESDTLGNYLDNSSTFTISKATPNLALGLPANLVYNNQPQTIYANSSIWEDSGINPTPNNLVLNLYLNNVSVYTPMANASSIYTQSGTNLASGEYNYILNTTGNNNYTSASQTGSFNISQATAGYSLSKPTNFTYDGNGESISYGINTINNQTPIYVSYNVTDNYGNVYNFTNVTYTANASATSISPTRAGNYSVWLTEYNSTNYTSQSSPVYNFTINQATGSVSLLINNVNGNTSIIQNTLIPINATSAETNPSNPNISILLNGTTIANANVNFASVNEQPPTPTLQEYTATATSNNYTAANQTFFLSVTNATFNATLEPSYNYYLSSGAINNTSGTLYNLLNYSYSVNYSSYWQLKNISINFGNGHIDVQNVSGTSGIAGGFYNTFTNNSNVTQNISITLTDIYNNSDTFNTILNTTPYVFPQITSPVVIFANIYGGNTPQNYTYVGVTTPIYVNQTSGSFPISNITINFGDGNSAFTTATNNTQIGINHVYSNYGSYEVSVNATDINGFNSINTTNFTVYNYSYGTVKILPPDLGFTTNQSYTFNFVPGTTAGNYVTVYWGDGTNSTYVFQQNGQGQNFVLYHNYTVPQTYSLSAYVTDVAGGTADVLVNPSLTIYTFTNPYISSIYPETPAEGATGNTINFTIQIQQSYPLRNMTIDWNDGYGNVASNITNINLTNISQATNLTDTIYVTHTFPFLTNYTINTNICDQLGDCEAQSFPIQLSFPLGANNTYNNLTDNQTLAEENANSINTEIAQNPTPYLFISFVILIIVIAGAVILWRRFKTG